MKKIILPTNPRQLRALKALSKNTVSRHGLDTIAGARNSPVLVSQLKKLGFDIKCKKKPMLDRDGRTVRPCIYFFADEKKAGGKAGAYGARKNQGGR